MGGNLLMVIKREPQQACVGNPQLLDNPVAPPSLTAFD